MYFSTYDFHGFPRNFLQHFLTVIRQKKPENKIKYYAACLAKASAELELYIIITQAISFLPRDATQSAVMPQCVVCPTVTFKYRDQIGWNTSKIISRLISLRFIFGLTPTWAICCNANAAKIRIQ